ncbi:MAG: hypothetical protein AB1650_02800 [Candidatus Omnitrophota bacterium]
MMNSFKTFHNEILSELNSILDVVRDYQKAFPILKELEKVLGEFMRLQGPKLYGALKARYSDDREAIKMLEFLEHDMNEMKLEFWSFLEEYSDHPAPIAIKNFPRRFLAFSERVISRIKIEEEYFFPLLGCV